METTYPEKCERYIQNLRRVRALSKPQFAPGTAPEALLEEIQEQRGVLLWADAGEQRPAE